MGCVPAETAKARRGKRVGEMRERCMEHCESKVGGVCTRPATWKQAVRAGQRRTGRILLHSYWCDVHAEAIVQKRRQAAPRMAATTRHAAAGN